MHRKLVKLVKATIKDIIVALLITTLILIMLELFFGQEISTAFSVANTISIQTGNQKQTEYDTQTSKIKVYPQYGTQYATLEIPAIDANLPVYYGDTLEILKKGVGHSSGSYFPGEGGSIIYMGHNSANVFRRFSELKKGNEIFIKTSYGDFKYKIYDMQIVEETETDKLPIQKDKEILMLYTCYPFKNIGYTTQRYVVYAELEQ